MERLRQKELADRQKRLDREAEELRWKAEAEERARLRLLEE